MVYRDGSTKPAKMSNLSNASPVRGTPQQQGRLTQMMSGVKHRTKEDMAPKTEVSRLD